ncbi:Uncharacterized protein GBIM_15036 [Gryllus bimaculatus]|nr:Uncharacterized protein GBIM_15036 [Gryllus bimaculatus]
MGKTQFLRRVAEEARLRAPRSWTVLVQALAHAAMLQRWPAPAVFLALFTGDEKNERAAVVAELSAAHVAELLAAAAGVAAGAEGEVGRRCLEAALSRSGALHVLVDGVDEVCPAYKDKLLRCLRLLQASRAALVWVATRPEVEAELSEALGCHPCTLRPLSKEQQEAFLCSHWAAAAAAGGVAPSAFQALAAELTDALHGALGRHPQRCLLDEAALAALRAGGGLLTNQNISLHDLYRRFVQTKRHLFKERYGLNDSKFQILAIPDVFDDIHNNCAMFVLISDGMYAEVDVQPFRDFVRRHEELIARDKNGLLWVHDDGSPHFAHYTLVDFFAARWLVGERGPVARAVWRCLAEGRGGARGLLRDVGAGQSIVGGGEWIAWQAKCAKERVSAVSVRGRSIVGGCEWTRGQSNV